MRRSVVIFILLLGTVFLYAENVNLIPQPEYVMQKGGSFLLNSDTKLFYNDPVAEKDVKMLQDFLEQHFSLALQSGKSKKIKKGIFFFYDETIPGEEYKLEIDNDKVVIYGSAPGLFYGMQTLMQLFPVENTTEISLPQLTVKDKPRFNYRGALLDAGRYFFSVAETKRFIDLMASYKLNILHWHLTEDGGWRIEIKKYPKLTEIGAWRRETQVNRNAPTQDCLPHGGYYTQEQIRDIVAYAAERNITIIPEFDMPGHTMALLSAYPEISCTGGPFKPIEMWGIQEDILCAGNEKTYRIVEDILDEMLDLFPSKIIHIGGDEAPKARWKNCPKCQAKIKEENLKDENALQGYYIKRICDYLESKGRRGLGWDEILESGAESNTMIMSWRGEKGGIEAAQKNHDVVMAPSTYLYIDYYQGKPENEPYNIGGFLPLERVYSYEPLTKEIPAEFHKHIVGVQANLWMEFIHTEKKLDYMAYPRLIALAEIGWSDKGKNYRDFTERLSYCLEWLDKKDVNFRIPEPYGLANAESNASSISVNLRIPVHNGKILYTTNGDDPLVNGKVYDGPIQLTLSKDKPVQLKCVVKTQRGRVSRTYDALYKKL